MSQAPSYPMGSLQNVPYGYINTNPPGSVFATESTFSPATQEFLLSDGEVLRDLYDATPQKWQLPELNMLLGKALTANVSTTGKSVKFFEKPLAMYPLLVTANAALVAANPGNSVTQTLTVDATTLAFYQPGYRVSYSATNTNAIGVIDSITNSTTVVIKSLVSKGFPAVTAGTPLGFLAVQGADGMSRINGLSRQPIITKNNYLMETYAQGSRWDYLERQQMINEQAFDYTGVDSARQAREILYSVHSNLWQSVKGEGVMNAPGEKYLSTGGIDWAMAQAGSTIQDVSIANLKDTFENTSFFTDKGRAGKMRYLTAHPRVLNKLAEQYKWEKTRFSPLDKSLDLELDKITFGGMDFGMMPVHQFGDAALFPGYGNRLYCIEWDNIDIVGMKGIPMFQYDMRTLSRTNANPGSLDDFEIRYARAFYGFKMNDMGRCYRFNINGL